MRDPRRRGQLQTMEPIVVAIFLAMIIGFLLMFYFRISDTKEDEGRMVQENMQDLLILKRMARMPEIACPRSETGQTYCIDLYKAMAFKDALSVERTRTAYYPLFGSSRINITVIDVAAGAQEPLTIYDGLGNAARVRTTIMYTTVYDPSEDPIFGTRKFAVITIERSIR